MEIKPLTRDKIKELNSKYYDNDNYIRKGNTVVRICLVEYIKSAVELLKQELLQESDMSSEYGLIIEDAINEAFEGIMKDEQDK